MLLTPIIAVLMCYSNNVNSQNHFEPIYGSSAPGYMNINIVEAKINNTVNLIAGDEIGIFDNDICVGMVKLSGDLGELIDAKTIGAIAGLDDTDTGEADGFTNGHSIIYKIWDASEGKEYSGDIIKYINNQGVEVLPPPTFEADGTVFVSVIGFPTGISNLNSIFFIISPNPTNGLLYIKFESEFEAKRKIQVYNQIGEGIINTTAESNTILDLSKYPKGIYYVKVISKESTFTKKVILN